jgi:hypothetical protein
VIVGAFTVWKAFLVIACIGFGQVVWGLAWRFGVQPRADDRWNYPYLKSAPRDIRRGAVLVLIGSVGVMVFHLA